MSVFDNQMHEAFAQGVAKGLTGDQVYQAPVTSRADQQPADYQQM